MNPSLMGYETAVLERLDPARRRAAADELLALEATVQGAPALRAALTDTAVTAVARRGVMEDVLRGKVSAEAARIAAFAAFAASAPDVPIALTDAALRAAAAADADGELDEPALSVTGSRARVGGYAACVFEELPTEALDGVEDDLFRWALTVSASPELRRAITNRDLPAPARAEIVVGLLAGRASEVTVRLARYAVVGGRPRDLLGTLDWLVDRVAEERGWRVARVRAARAIDEEAGDRLSATLRGLVGRPVELQVEPRPELLGGVVVEVGDLRVDATVRGRLDALAEALRAGRSDGAGATTATQGAS